jgi:hypothetical protein
MKWKGRDYFMGKKQLATTIDESLIKELKVYAAENGQQLNTVLENALYLWFAITNKKGWHEMAQCMPTGTFAGSALQQFAYEQDGKGTRI